jgi:hypothetical protein
MTALKNYQNTIAKLEEKNSVQERDIKFYITTIDSLNYEI